MGRLREKPKLKRDEAERRIRELRIKGLTQEQIAAELDISQSTVSKLERGTPWH
jgi:transcriptional regulator with XRE-family HTH domain